MHPAIRLSSIVYLSLCLAVPSLAANSSTSPDEGVARQGSVKAIENPERLDPNVFHCGPIQAKDPAIRAQIEALYKEQWDFQQSTFAQLRDLSEAVNSATDPETRQALAKEGGELKQTLQLRNLELGLQIARLNEDAQRVAEFEKALDQFLHPEKWMPVYTPDPELRARRLRELGITK